MVICAATVKASLSASARAKDNGFSLVSEESIPAGTKKKERLSRQERAAVVESFVLKYVEVIYVCTTLDYSHADYWISGRRLGCA